MIFDTDTNNSAKNKNDFRQKTTLISQNFPSDMRVFDANRRKFKNHKLV